MINCPYCGKLTDPQLDGCVHCGGLLKKQAPPGRTKRPGQTSQTCPNCGALVREGDIICVACGTNLLTGQKITEERKAAKKASANRLPYVIAAVLVAAIAIFAAVAIAYILQDPVARAQRLSAAGRTTEAIGILEARVGKAPDDARALFELGKSYFRAKDYDRAADAFEKTSRLDTANREAALLGVASYGQAPSTASRDNQIEILERLVESSPDDPDALYLLGLARGASKDYAGLVAAAEQSLARDMTNTDHARILGVGYALQDNLTGAEREIGGAVANQPGDADALAALGIVASLKNDAAGAATRLQEAINAGTSIAPEVRTRLALLYVNEGKYREALEHLDQALAGQPGNSTAKYFRAVCLENLRMTQQAQADYESLIAEAGPFQAKAAVQSARIDLALQNADRALSTLNRVTTQQSGLDGAGFETVRGRALWRIADVSGASDAFRKAIQSDPDYAPAHLEMGLLQIEQGNLSEGIRELDRYLSLVDASDPESGADKIQSLIEQLRQSTQLSTPAATPSAPTRAARSIS
jgi:tetratricopeptide (TPR) repeat protein